VAECVVHVLEVVQIDEEHGDHLSVSFGKGQRHFEAVVEELSVGQSGQSVVVGLIFKLFLALFDL